MFFLIGFYNYTVWLTFIGMLSSVVGMGFAVQGKIIAAVICLMFSGFCDMFDGIVARTKKDRTDEEKRFGIQLDSLSDIVCFGVLPFVIGVSVGAREWWQIAIMALFALLIIRGYWIALHARDRFGSLLAIGVTTQIALQVFLNIAVVSNLIPNTGISLPFFSYGGTALAVQLAEIGIVRSVSRQMR